MIPWRLSDSNSNPLVLREMTGLRRSHDLLSLLPSLTPLQHSSSISLTSSLPLTLGLGCVSPLLACGICFIACRRCEEGRSLLQHVCCSLLSSRHFPLSSIIPLLSYLFSSFCSRNGLSSPATCTPWTISGKSV